jgi:hypothetical protein
MNASGAIDYGVGLGDRETENESNDDALHFGAPI